MKRLISRITKVALGATFCFATMLMVVPTKALSCKDVNIIFMRGSSQNYTPSEGEDINFPSWKIINDRVEFNDPRDIQQIKDNKPAFVYTEKESLKYFKSIGDRIHLDYPKLTMQFVSPHDFAGKYNSNGYKAVSAFGPWQQAFVSSNAIDAKYGNYAVVAGATSDQYNQSVKDGAEELAGYLQDQMTSCPSQYNVVGGYSQGAHVVGEAMAKMHGAGQDNLLSRLGHVDMYGDPKFNGFERTTSVLNPLQQHAVLPWTRGSATTNHTGALGPRKPYVPDILTAKTTTWCDFNDLVCGGYAGIAINYDAHAEKYREDSGWIEQSANEIYVDLKTRLGLLAGITDKSANSPLAFWNGIKKPDKLDVMFVMDRTGDNNISLMPDPDYIAWNLAYLGEKGYTSTQVGVVTYTELSRYDGSKYLIESIVKTPTNLTTDIFGDYSYFKDSWGKAHFQNPPSLGEDLRDSPYSAISAALDQSWRKDARKVIVVFSNSYGKDKEDTTNLTMKQVTNKARAKDVEILPVFTAKTFKADANKAAFLPAANAFWQALAGPTSGHATELNDLIYDRLVYDVIMSHSYAPDAEISMGKTYNKPSAAAKKESAPTTIKGTKPVVKAATATKLTAAKSNASKSKIKTYTWDLNGDGVADHTSKTPDIDIDFTPGDHEVCVTVTDETYSATTVCQDITASDNDGDVTHQDPAVLQAPVMAATRVGNNLKLAWSPVSGDITLADEQGAVIVTMDGMAGSFTLTDVPTTAFVVSVTRRVGNDTSDPVSLYIDALPTVPPSPTTDTTPPVSTETTQQPPATTLTEALGAQTGLPQNFSAASYKAIVTGGAVQGSGTTAPTSGALKLPTVNLSGITSLFTRGAARIKFAGLVLYFAFWSNVLALLLLAILLLLILAIVSRDRDQKTYKHHKQYTYAQKTLKQASYKL